MSNFLWPPWTAAHQASLSLNISQSLPKFMSIAFVTPSSHLILWHSLLRPSIFPASGTFPTNQLFTSYDQNTGASASVLPMGIQGWFSLRLIGLISLLSKKLSGVFPSTTVQRYQFFGTPPSLRPALSTIHDHWEDYSLDCMYLCWQNDISAFQHTIQVCHTFPARSSRLLISGCKHHPQGF